MTSSTILNKDRFDRFLALLTEPGKCKACGAEVAWVRTKRNQLVMYNRDLSPHDETCVAKKKKVHSKDARES